MGKRISSLLTSVNIGAVITVAVLIKYFASIEENLDVKQIWNIVKIMTFKMYLSEYFRENW